MTTRSTSRAPAPHRRVRRGSAEDHQELRRRIVAAAFALHAREGVGGLSMRHIAAEVGLSTMALYRYYPSKADLLRAMWEVVLTQARDSVRDAMARGRTARERVRVSIEAFIAYWETHPSHFLLVYMTAETMHPGSEPSPLTRSATYASAIDLVTPVIAEMIEELGGHPERVLVARDLRMALMVGYLHARLVNKRFPWSDLDALRAAAIETIANGIEACVRTPPATGAKGRARR